MNQDQAPESAPAETAIDWRAVHVVTPLIQAIKGLAVLAAFAVWQLFDIVQDQIDEIAGSARALPSYVFLIVVGVIVAIIIVIGLYSFLAWRRIQYAIGEEAVYYHHGILFRNQRHARLNRIQAVDIVRPLLARFFGLAAVDVQTAGGANSNVQIQFLKEDDAQRVRNEILARAAGVKAGQAAPDASADFVEAPERQVLNVGFGQLITSILMSPALVIFTLATVIGIVIAIANGAWGFLFGMVPAIIGLVSWLWARVAGEFDFTLAISPDGIRSRHGLTETRAQTIPPRRIQAVGITQPMLWRLKDWWRVEVNVAGYGGSGESDKSSTSDTKTVLLPVGSRLDLERVLWLIVPDLGVDDPQAVISALLTGTGSAQGFYTAPRRARYLDWFTWRRHGLKVTRTVLLIRGGFFVRRAAVVPHERTQSLGIEQGPLERALKLANFAAHSVSGPVYTKTHHLPEEVALTVLVEQAERARIARGHEGPEEWMRRAVSVAS